MAEQSDTTNPSASSPERAEKIRKLVFDLDGPLGRINECKGTICHLTDFIEDEALKDVFFRVSSVLDHQVCIARKIFADLHTVAVRGEEVSS